MLFDEKSFILWCNEVSFILLFCPLLCKKKPMSSRDTCCNNFFLPRASQSMTPASTCQLLQLLSINA